MSDNFACDSYGKEAAQALRRPFTPGAVFFKVQQGAPPAPGIVVCFLNARSVVERLNAVVPGLWTDTYEKFDQKHLICRLTVDGITREDVGVFGSEGAGRADPIKTGYSDALKRAAVKFGVGVSLYAMKEIRLRGGDRPDQLTVRERRTRDGNKKVYEISPGCETHLRDLYAAWLDLDRGGKQFGEPLDHGDDPEGSVGELADVAADAPADDEAPTVDPERREQLVTLIVGLYAELKSHNGRTPITKGQLDAMLAGASTEEEFNGIAEQIRTKIKEATNG